MCVVLILSADRLVVGPTFLVFSLLEQKVIDHFFPCNIIIIEKDGSCFYRLLL